MPFIILKKNYDNLKPLTNAADSKKRIFLKKCIKKLRVLKRFLSLRKSTEQFIIFSGKVYFYLTLPYNNHNNWYLGDSAQEYGVELPLHDSKLLVWCATSANRVFGPNVFDGTVSSTNYLKMLKSFFGPRF
jgi:hypothetical protein